MSSTIVKTRKDKGPRDYIKVRGQVYWVRFQYPPALQESACDFYGVDSWPKERSWSLGTKDELAARRRDQDAISLHYDLLAFHHGRHSDAHMADLGYDYEMEPDTQERKPDGTLIVASAATITTIHGDDRIESRPNNKRPVMRYTEAALKLPVVQQAVKERKKLEGILYTDPDTDVIERYLDRRFGKADEATGKRPRDDKGDIGMLRFALRIWKEFSGGKLLKNASRLEVATMIKQEIENRAEEDNELAGYERVKKMVKTLIAAINEDKKDPANSQFEHNPFANPDWSVYEENYVPRKPLPFSEEDIRTIKANKGVFTREEYTMVAMHCSMSVCPVGLHSITREEWVAEDEYDMGVNLVKAHCIRCVYIETDKDKRYGKRRLPLPDSILQETWIDGTPLLPETVKGKLFPSNPAELNREINKKLRDIGVAGDDVNKRLYSGRHRARQRLEACFDEDVRRYIMGHTHERDAHNAYGGKRAYKIKPWIDIIGF